MVAVLFIAGDQVPVIPLLDDVGKVNELPEQIGANWVKDGVIFPEVVFIVTKTVSVQLMAEVTIHEYVPEQRFVAVAEF